MAEYDSRPETHEHIAVVRGLMLGVAHGLLDRAHRHDVSKLEEPEREMFDRFTARLRATTYGSEEYERCREEMGEALRHHYAHNSHHPEFGEQGMEWRAVVGFEGSYEVSSFGDVRSVARTVKRDGPRGDLSVSEHVLRAQVTPKGYLRIQLGRGGQSANRLVHRLVAEAFLANPESKPEVNHRDGRKANNRLENLEWVTSSENQVHAYDTGLRESNVKYVIYCPELDLTAWGTAAMERAVRAAGFTRVTAAGVWDAMDREGKHFDLTFEGTLVADYRRSRVERMNLVDLLEMLCDWVAATRRHADGDIQRSIEQNAERFGYGPELAGLLHNSVQDILDAEVSAHG